MSHPHEAIAHAWVDAFNRGDVAALVSLYAEDCTHTSPRLRALHPESGGRLQGKVALADWWTGALQRLPGLRYELRTLTCCDERVVLEYVRHAPGEAPAPVAEAFDIAGGRIIASRVYPG
jgi:hypothetical protein